MGVGASVWVVYEPSFAIFNALGLSVACLLFCLGARRGLNSTPAMVVPLCCLLTIPFGVYPLLAAVFLVGKRTFLSAPKRSAKILSILIILLTPFLLRTFVYHDKAYDLMLIESNGFRFDWDSTPVGTQLAMERCARAADWEGVMRIARECRKDKAHDYLRMEIAYRILAQYKLGTVMDELFDYPIPTCHNNNEAQEALMDGYYLLYEYGLLYPARREVYEQMSTKGWQPYHFQVLGDIALIRGENELAKKDYAQLARCPFRRRTPIERLKPLAESARVWNLWASTRDLPFFTTDGGNTETFIYDCFHNLKNANEPMVKMFVASSLLNCDVKILGENAAIFNHFCPPPKPWPKHVVAALKDLPGTPYYTYAHTVFVPYRNDSL